MYIKAQWTTSFNTRYVSTLTHRKMLFQKYKFFVGFDYYNLDKIIKKINLNKIPRFTCELI